MSLLQVQSKLPVHITDKGCVEETRQFTVSVDLIKSQMWLLRVIGLHNISRVLSAEGSLMVRKWRENKRFSVLSFNYSAVMYSIQTRGMSCKAEQWKWMENVIIDCDSVPGENGVSRGELRQDKLAMDCNFRAVVGEGDTWWTREQSPWDGWKTGK